jgi:CheY-like chemotaxis protein
MVMCPSARPRLLAVDDEPLARQSYRGLLRRYGDAVILGSVAEAKRELDQGAAFDAFLFDLQLGDGTGLELLAHSRRTHPRTPALVLTGHVQAWVANEAFDLGAETLGKPFDVPRMQHWIERALGIDRQPPSEPEAPAIRARIEFLRRLFARQPCDASTRYLIGTAIADLKAHPERYGHGAVAVAAVALGQDEASLYRFARVAERWPASAFEELANRTMRDGKKPRWSHLVLLASVEPEAVRASLVERVIEESMPVRRLAEAIAEAEKRG